MSSDKIIRWLHLSDFHTGKDLTGQYEVFESLLKHIEGKLEANLGPDFVFITGDIANKGQKLEYDAFYKSFFYPLIELLGTDGLGRVFVIPGNHDVNVQEAEAVQRYGILDKLPRFLDNTQEGLKQRKILFDRFQEYRNAELHHFVDATSDQMFQSAGAYSVHLMVKNYRVGILCLNTAWLSGIEDGSEGDRHQMSPGLPIVTSGLRSIGDSQIKIILGHHPIDWYRDDELETIRNLFRDNNVFYLHGHLHKTKVNYQFTPFASNIELQAGATFQARQDERWGNEILWCEMNYDQKILYLELYKWSKDYQRWTPDNSAFHPDYKRTPQGVVEIPFFNIASMQDTNSGYIERHQSVVEIDPPQGWGWIDKKFLDKRRNDKIQENDFIAYFNGVLPTGHSPRWGLILSPYIRPRKIVDKLLSRLEDSKNTADLRLTLFSGPGGEGKTTALMQTISLLAEQGWNILWHHDKDTFLPMEFIQKLLNTSNPCLVVSDEGDRIAENIFDCIKELRRNKGKNIQFLLACRDTDWKSIPKLGDKKIWREFISFEEEPLDKFTPDDAKLIAYAWYSTNTLQVMGVESHEEAAELLYTIAKDEPYKQDGVLLGALLRIRGGDYLKERVNEILNKFQQIQTPFGDLRKIFAYIAALHAYDRRLLSRDVLARIFSCDLDTLQESILTPLGKEAVTGNSGRLVLTRHGAIAEAAVEILYDSLDMDNICIEIVKNAVSIHLKDHIYVPRLGEWRDLSRDFRDHGNEILGIRLAQELHKLDETDPFYAARLGQLMRESEDPSTREEAVKQFRDHFHQVRRDRAYYHEWGTTEGFNGNLAVSIWLISIAVCDDEFLDELKDDRCKISLNGLSIAFDHLWETTANSLYKQARDAATQLGLTLPVKGNTVKTQDKLKQRQIDKQMVKMDAVNSYLYLVDGIQHAWEHREIQTLLLVRNVTELGFETLRYKLRIQSS